jgi:surfactin synthase thioesterase subunit
MKKLRSLFAGIHWMNHFFAFVGTCAGVLLAFFLTDYQEKRNHKDRLEKVVAQLVLEIEQNKNILKNHSDYLSKQVNAITIVKPLLRADTTILATEHQIGAIIDSFPEFFVPEKRHWLRTPFMNGKET